jgi:hypothetical protein
VIVSKDVPLGAIIVGLNPLFTVSGDGVGDGEDVGEGEAVGVDVEVGLGVLDGVDVFVGVLVLVGVAVFVGVLVAVPVCVGVPVFVAVLVGVLVEVFVAVFVLVGVFVFVGVAVAAAFTVKVATLLPTPVGTPVALTPLVLLGLVPIALLVITTVTVQLPLIGIVSPVKLRLVLPEVKLLEPAPTHVPPAVWLPLIDILISVSVKAALVRAPVLPLVSVKVIVLVPPAMIVVGANALIIVGETAAALTVKVATLLPAPAIGTSVVVTPLVLLGLVPTVALVTTTVTVQLLLAGIMIPVKLSAVVSAGRVLGVVPVQVPPTPSEALGVVMLVSASVKLALCKMPGSALVSVKVIVLVPPDWMVVGLNALAIVGATGLALTVRLATLLPAPAAGTSVVVTPLLLFGLFPT